MVAWVAGEPLPHIPGEGDSPVGEQGVSFNGGTRQENYEGVRRGNGKVIIKLIK